MNRNNIKVVLVDDESRALNRLKLLLAHFTEIEIIEQFDESKPALAFIIEQQPELVFLDIEMPELSGLEMAKEIQKNSFITKIVIISSHDHYAITAIKRQVFDYLLKPVSIDDLKTTIHRYKADVLTTLTQRETEIIRLIAKGFNSQQIGEQLFISRHTVDTYRRKILEKTDCKNAAELVLYSSKNGII